jgi:hypothetical protein
MNKLVSFEQFSSQKAEQTAAIVREEQEAKRTNSANTFKALLSEYGVATVKELAEEQRSEFFEKLRGQGISESIVIDNDSVTEAIKVSSKRNANKVLNVYSKIFAEASLLTKDKEVHMMSLRELFWLSMEDANFSKEGYQLLRIFKAPSKFKTITINSPELGNFAVTVGPQTINAYLNSVCNRISSAGDWGGITIVEGTALYLESIGYTSEAQILIDSFNAMFNESKLHEATINVDAYQPKDQNLKKLLKKNNVTIEILGENPAGWEVKLTGSKKDLTTVLSDPNVGWDDPELAEYIQESKVNEAEIKSDEEFKEYAMTVLKKAFGADFDEAKANDVVAGILGKSKGDYGTAVGMLTSSLGESVIVEAKEHSFVFNYNTDEDDIKYIQKILDKAGADAIAKAGLDSEEMIVRAFSAKDLTKAKKAIEADGFEINESIDVKYWSDYNTDTSGQGNKDFEEKSTDFDSTWETAVNDWNDNNEMGEENELTPAMAKKVEKIAKEFFKKAGWISVNVAGAMISQES